MKPIKTTEKVLRLLADGEHHSGEEIGQSLGISRSAIWKAIHEVSEKYQLDIHSTPGKGYRLGKKMTFLDSKAISAELDPKHRAELQDIVILDQTPSTNDYLLEALKSQRHGNIACFAEQQTQGKGRRGRSWISPFGHNIYHSLLWSFRKDAAELTGLSLAIAVAVLDAIRAYLDPKISSSLGLKWPNDIYFGDQKLAGILLEMSSQAHDACHLVIGVGINTHVSKKEAEKINQPFTSLDEIEKGSTQRNRLAGIVLNQLIATLVHFEKKGFLPYLNRWSSHDYLKNRKIQLKYQDKIITGMVRGISDQGALLLEMNGKIQSFLSGDTQVILAS